LNIRKENGRVAEASDVPGFSDWALSSAAKKMVLDLDSNSELAEDLRHSSEKIAEAIGLPPFVQVFGGERGKCYPRFERYPTEKELLNLAKRKQGGGKCA
jgi:hypothetical protein